MLWKVWSKPYPVLCLTWESMYLVSVCNIPFMATLKKEINSIIVELRVQRLNIQIKWSINGYTVSKLYCDIYKSTAHFNDNTIHLSVSTLRFQLEDMFQIVDTPQSIKVYKPIKRHTYKGICNRCQVVFIKGAPRSASKLGIDPINSHASYFGTSKMSFANNRLTHLQIFYTNFISF